MQSLVIVQTIRLAARVLWYTGKLIRWIKKEDINKIIQEGHLPLLGWSIVILILASELLLT